MGPKFSHMTTYIHESTMVFISGMGWCQSFGSQRRWSNFDYFGTFKSDCRLWILWNSRIRSSFSYVLRSDPRPFGCYCVEKPRRQYFYSSRLEYWSSKLCKMYNTIVYILVVSHFRRKMAIFIGQIIEFVP